MMGLELFPAGLFLANPPTDPNLKAQSIRPVLSNASYIEHWKKTKAKLVLPGDGRTFVDFGRFLAKIAHSYAVAKLGVGMFIPFLTRAVRNEYPMNLSHYVGGQVSQYKPKGMVALHDLSIGLCSAPAFKSELIFVNVRLFAPFSLPSYEIIVGQATRATARP
jgi:hypothetical protein